MIVEALTDNRNRTASDVRHTFAKFGGNLGTTGAVAWQFERRGVVLVAADGVDEDELFLAAADAGAEDLAQDGDVFQVTSAPENLAAVREAIEAAGFTIESAELSMLPKNTVAVDDEGKAKQRDAADRRARGQRRRPGRLRELRHPRAGARGRNRLAHERRRRRGAARRVRRRAALARVQGALGCPGGLDRRRRASPPSR